MNQQEIFTYIQKQYPTHPDLVDGQAETDGETGADRQGQTDRQQTVRQKKKIDNSDHTFHNDDSGSRELTGKMGETT